MNTLSLSGNSRAPLRIAAIYLAVSVCWIVFSDRIVSLLVHDPALMTELQTFKGWFFVGTTALLIYLLLQREIVALHQTLERLRASRQELRDILDVMPVGIALTDGTAIEYTNVSFSELFGYSLDEIATEEQWFLHAYPDPNYRETLVRMWREELAQAREGGTPIRPVEVRVSCKNGTLRHVIVNTQLIGERILVIFTDITERERLQSELGKIHKLESIGVLAGGIAHDFNNILTGIMGNLSYARMLLEPDHPAGTPLASAEQASLRAAELTRQLLTFSRGGEPIKKVVVIGRLIEETAILMLRGTNVRLELHIDNPVESVEADEGQIGQVLTNIIINAVQAMPDGGVLRIAAVSVELEDGVLPPLPAGRYVRIVISDEGTGIAEEIRGRIFDPYFSTKPAGSGLGLASAYSIVIRHGGAIAVESPPGKGASFIIHLPSCDAELPEQPACAPVPGEAGLRHASVLLMDDEEMIRDLAASMLDHLGYDVVTCADGAKAVEHYAERLSAGTPYDAVIMDLTVPGGMGGVEAAGRILALDAGAGLIVSSGYSHDPIMAEFGRYGFQGVLVKPYRAAELACVLEEVLAGKRAEVASADQGGES